MWLCGSRELFPVNIPRCEGHPPGLGSTPPGGMSPAPKDSHPRETLCARGGHRAQGKLAEALGCREGGEGRGGRRRARRQGETVGKRQEASSPFGAASQTPPRFSGARSTAGGPGRSGLSRRRAAGRRAPLPVSHSHRLSPDEGHLTRPAGGCPAAGLPRGATRGSPQGPRRCQPPARRRGSAVGRGSSSPPPPEVEPGGAVGQRRHFPQGRGCRQERSPRRSSGGSAGSPGDDGRLAAPRLPGGGAGRGRLLSEGM